LETLDIGRRFMFIRFTVKRIVEKREFLIQIMLLMRREDWKKNNEQRGKNETKRKRNMSQGKGQNVFCC
jgi:hypothetical protein